MKQMFPLLCLAGLMLVAGCKEKKTTDDIITRKVEVKKPQAPIRMQEYTQKKEVNWLGKQYMVEIHRTADDSLAMVKDEVGQKFVDNRISLQVIRADGSIFFQRTFTKADFQSYLDDDYRRTGILEGFVFDEVDGKQLEFAASVCHPQTDEYIPFEIKVDNFGNVSIKRDSELDTRGDDADDDDDDD